LFFATPPFLYSTIPAPGCKPMPEMSHKNHKKVQNPDADIIP